LVLAELQVKVN